MSTLTPEAAASRGPHRSEGDRPSWVRVLIWLTAVIAATDLLFFALIAEVIPPLAVGAVLTVVGIVVVRRAPRAGIVVLGVTNLVMLVGNAPFAIDHLAHPASAVDFTHAVVGSVGRVLAVTATVGAWRGASPAGARRFGVAAVGLAAATVVVAAVAMLTASGDDAEADDVPVAVVEAAFPARIAAATGDTLFVDNRDLFRHTFTVEGTDLDVELPATQGVRIPLELAPGSYEVVCAVPGHDFMQASLEVR
jgi:plastocyanin